MIKFKNNMIHGTVSERDHEYRIAVHIPCDELADDDSVADVMSSFEKVLELVRECAGIEEAVEALKALKGESKIKN